jgi:cytochrome P450
MAHRQQRTAEADATVTHHFNIVPCLDDRWYDSASYYGIEVLTALTLLSTIGNVVTLLVRHLLADAALHARVLREVEALRGDDGVVDVAPLFEACPSLAAAWYETLRVHATLVPRQATGDFAVAGRWAVRRGDIIVLPMSAANSDAASWGADAGEFRPGRFLLDGGGGGGALDLRRARRVRGFGVAGNLCPGRYFGHSTAMAVVVALLLHVEMRSVRGQWPVPKVARGFTAGMQRVGDEVEADVGRKAGGTSGGFKIRNSGPSNRC